MCNEDLSQSAKRILIVQNETRLVRDLAQVLEDLGYRVSGRVASAKEAVEMIQVCRPSLVLMDVSLEEEKDVIEAAEQIRSVHDVPLILLTADSGKLSPERVRAMKPSAYLSTPVSSQNLHATVEMAVYRRKMERLLRQSEEKYRLLIQKSRDAIYISSRDGTVMEVNQAFLDLFGYREEDIQGLDIDQIYVDSGGRRVFQVNIERTGSVKDYETQYRTKDGGVIDCLETATVRRGANGDILGYQGIIRDITERKRSEEALRRSRERLRVKLDYMLSPEREFYDVTLQDLFEVERLQKIQDSFTAAAGVASIITDVDGNPITEASNFCGVCQTVRSTEKGLRRCIESDKILGEKARRLLVPTYQECLSCGFVDASAPIIVGGKHIANWLIGQTNVAGVDASRIEEYAQEIGTNSENMLKAFNSMENMSLSRFKEILDLLWHLAIEMSTLAYNNLKLARELTQRKLMEERIRTLTQALLKAQESERERISRDLHDHLGQDLSSLRMAYEMFLDDLGNLDPEMKKRGELLAISLQESIADVRELSYGLRPAGLDRLGFVRVVSRYCKEYSARTGIRVSLQTAQTSGLLLDSETSINLFRVVQEALRNVEKHAEAHLVVLWLASSPDSFVLAVKDDGKSFDVNSRSLTGLEGNRMGLLGMKERVLLLNGEMRISSEPGRGTSILVKIPVRRRDNGSDQKGFDSR